MKVLVTGADGFVGRAVVMRLAALGHRVRGGVHHFDGIRPADVEWCSADVEDIRQLESACRGVDAVIHCAGKLGEFGRRDAFWNVNVIGTQKVLQACGAAGVGRLVFVGSPSALMDRRDGDQFDIDETVSYPTAFFNAYSETKAVAERHVVNANSDALTTVSLRPRAVWGPGDFTGPIATIVAKLKAGRLPDLSTTTPVFAGMCYIDHLVEACVNAADPATTDASNIGGNSYFVADARPVDIWDAIRQLAAAFDAPAPIRQINPRVLEVALCAVEAAWRIPFVSNHIEPPLTRYSVALLTRSTTYNITAARRDLAYLPVVDFASGLREFHRWAAGRLGAPAFKS